MTPLVRQEHQLPIPVPQVLIMNAARPAKTVQQLVPADILYLIPVGATIQRQTNAETLVINPKPVVPIPVPAVQNTTPVLMLQRPNAVQPAITVQTVVQAVQLLIPVLMPQLLNAEVVAIIVPVVAQVALRLFPVLRVIQKLPLAQPNVALLAMNALRTILATTILQKLVIMDVLLTIPTVRQSARPVTPITATTEPPSSLPVRQTRPAPISPTAPPKFRAGPATLDIRNREVPV